MLVPGTQMHFVTFGFICIEIVILFYLIIYRLARPDNETTYLDIILIILLLLYNTTGGLLPDKNLPGSYFVQNSIAYGTGFITPCYFPYYVYKAFGLEKMRFHACRGVYFFLILPYFLFVAVFAYTGDLEKTQNLLILPVLYGLWVIASLVKSVRYKYGEKLNTPDSRIEIWILFLSLTPWVGLPLITYFEASQWLEALITNSGFLLLMGYHLNQTIKTMREEHQRLIESEKRLTMWNEELKLEVEKRTQQLERLSKEERISENCRFYKLTTREQGIAQLICQGMTYRQIGEELFIAETTVAKHAQNIFEKVGVSNKMELREKLERIPNSM